jgi:hypothetical protein
VRDVVGHPAHPLGVQPGQRGLEEQRGAPRVERAQPLPVLRRDVVAGGRRQLRVVGVRHGVELARLDPRLPQAERHRLLGQLPGRERDRGLAVLAAAEALLFGRRDGVAVHHERRGGVVEHGIDAQHLHVPGPLREALLR